MGTSVAGAAAYATTVVVGTLVFVALGEEACPDSCNSPGSVAVVESRRPAPLRPDAVLAVWTALWFGVLRNIKEVRYVLTGEGPESTGRRSGRRRHREPAGSTGSHAKAS